MSSRSCICFSYYIWLLHVKEGEKLNSLIIVINTVIRCQSAPLMKEFLRQLLGVLSADGFHLVVLSSLLPLEKAPMSCGVPHPCLSSMAIQKPGYLRPTLVGHPALGSLQLWGWLLLGLQVSQLSLWPIFLLHSHFPKCWSEEHTLITILHVNLHHSKY